MNGDGADSSYAIGDKDDVTVKKKLHVRGPFVGW